jgi:hypothetical protein
VANITTLICDRGNNKKLIMKRIQINVHFCDWKLNSVLSIVQKVEYIEINSWTSKIMRMNEVNESAKLPL